MLRTLFNWAQAHPERELDVATAAVAHMTQEALLLHTDRVYSWSQTRWPTFVEIAQYIVDECACPLATAMNAALPHTKQAEQTAKKSSEARQPHAGVVLQL